ncbi:winged helix-turn-helix domain-containing protein [uncultured Slackia sp.]|uniref:winged helix-turn-helix domain-containing protein n=1 Tax=uncultured Slackia sp. TaxID=665903 RepID=UPI0026E09D7D|nr:LysR family transcriptional regulator [uncultured Slackia sp.]
MHFADISPRIKLSLEGTSEQHDAIFGRGVAQLCRGVDRTGSLNKAAKEIGMAYSKAWRIIKHTEEAFSMQLLDRNGAHGSTLTDEGKALLDAYERLEQDIERFAQERIEAIASDLDR